MTRRQFAIIGAGPAGLYTADRLSRGDPAAAVDVYDRLATPLGLIRYGVAPDHQATKNVARMLLKPFERPGVAFHGGVRIGAAGGGGAVGLDQLRAAYDAVILATGCPADRRLGLAGDDGPGVLIAGQFVGWYNDHPDQAALILPGGPIRHVVVIGAGNVALDVARVIAKARPSAEGGLAGSDLAPDRAAQLADWPIETITLVARRSAADVRFSPGELAELGQLAQAAPRVDAADLPPAGDDGPVLALLRGFTAPRAAPVRIQFRFDLAPVAIVPAGTGRPGLAAIRFAGPDGRTVDLPADLAVSCIGFQGDGALGLALQDGVITNRDGRIAEGLYAVGWAARGASGTIPASRVDAQRVADLVLADSVAGEGPGREGASAILPLLAAAGVARYGAADWAAIDAAERAAAGADRVRRKLRTAAEFAALRQAGAAVEKAVGAGA